MRKIISIYLLVVIFASCTFAFSCSDYELFLHNHIHNKCTFLFYLEKFGPTICSFISVLISIYCAHLAKSSLLMSNYANMVLEQSKKLFPEMYGCIAIANVIHNRILNSQDIDSYRYKYLKHSSYIIKEKNSFLPFLGDSTNSLRAIARIPSWIQHQSFKNDAQKRELLISTGTDLRKAIEKALMYSINHGKKPQKKLLDNIDSLEQNIYDQFRASNPTTVEDNEYPFE